MKKILIAEDDVDLCRLVMLWCARLGHQPVPALDGDAALQLAEQERPDIIVTDVMMPNMDGPTFLAETAKVPVLAKVPVVIMTGMGSFNTNYQNASGQVHKVLLKPVTYRQFRDVIHEILLEQEIP
jgi:CheY-like chemotaxis protein